MRATFGLGAVAGDDSRVVFDPFAVDIAGVRSRLLRGRVELVVACCAPVIAPICTLRDIAVPKNANQLHPLRRKYGFPRSQKDRYLNFCYTSEMNNQKPKDTHYQRRRCD
jgi:hypothetical protein